MLKIPEVPKVTIKEQPYCDDLKEALIPVKGKKKITRAPLFKKFSNENPYVDQIIRIGRSRGVGLEIFYSPDLEKIIIFGTNKKGFRWEFLRVEEPGGAFRVLDGRAVKHVEQVFYHNRSLKAKKDFFLGLGRARERARIKGEKEDLERLTYMGMQYRRTMQAMGRIIGINQGKVNMPYGRLRVR